MKKCVYLILLRQMILMNDLYIATFLMYIIQYSKFYKSVHKKYKHFIVKIFHIKRAYKDSVEAQLEKCN